MSGRDQSEATQFVRWLESLPPERRDEISREQHEASEEEHREFREKFAAGDCYLCSDPLTSFNAKSPCLHWLLKPPGFRKRDFEKITQKYGMMELQSFLRWVANEEAFARNITDSGDLEGDGHLVEVTIKFKGLEWSISCGKNDYSGHANANKGAFPHYHFQMRVDHRPFINYNDFHLLLKRRELINIDAIRSSAVVKHRFNHGEAIQDLLTDENLEKIVNTPVEPGDPETAPFRFDTFLMADEGTQMSGEDIYSLIEEAKAKGVTIASLAQKVPNASVRVVVSEGPGVVDPAPRSPRKSRGEPL